MFVKNVVILVLTCVRYVSMKTIKTHFENLKYPIPKEYKNILIVYLENIVLKG